MLFFRFCWLNFWGQNLCAFLAFIIVVGSSDIFCKRNKYFNYMEECSLEHNTLTYLYNIVLPEGFYSSAVIL